MLTQPNYATIIGGERFWLRDREDDGERKSKGEKEHDARYRARQKKKAKKNWNELALRRDKLRMGETS